VPQGVRELQDLSTPSVRTATVGGKAMPGLSISNGTRAAIFYDITKPPPVLRTLDPNAVNWEENTS